MIGRFNYEVNPPEDCVAICMLWTQDGKRSALLNIPVYLQDEVEQQSLPDPDETFSLDGALAYGVVLSIRSGLGLRLSGDLSVWREEWGQVIHVH